MHSGQVPTQSITNFKQCRLPARVHCDSAIEDPELSDWNGRYSRNIEQTRLYRFDATDRRRPLVRNWRSEVVKEARNWAVEFVLDSMA